MRFLFVTTEGLTRVFLLQKLERQSHQNQSCHAATKAPHIQPRGHLPCLLRSHHLFPLDNSPEDLDRKILDSARRPSRKERECEPNSFGSQFRVLGLLSLVLPQTLHEAAPCWTLESGERYSAALCHGYGQVLLVCPSCTDTDFSSCFGLTEDAGRGTSPWVLKHSRGMTKNRAARARCNLSRHGKKGRKEGRKREVSGGRRSPCEAGSPRAVPSAHPQVSLFPPPRSFSKG